MTKPTIDSKIDRIIETLLVRPLNTPGAYAETEKLKGAIKALLTEARIDQTVHLKAELLAKIEDLHFCCGDNDEEFLSGRLDKDLCCGCYPHESCKIAKHRTEITKIIEKEL